MILPPLVFPGQALQPTTTRDYRQVLLDMRWVLMMGNVFPSSLTVVRNKLECLHVTIFSGQSKIYVPRAFLQCSQKQTCLKRLSRDMGNGKSLPELIELTLSFSCQSRQKMVDTYKHSSLFKQRDCDKLLFKLNTILRQSLRHQKHNTFYHSEWQERLFESKHASRQ